MIELMNFEFSREGAVCTLQLKFHDELVMNKVSANIGDPTHQGDVRRRLASPALRLAAGR